jgi:hypothetical protein
MPSTARRIPPPAAYRLPSRSPNPAQHWIKVFVWTLILAGCVSFWVVAIKTLLTFF